MQKQPASLDTSFWNAAFRVGVNAYLFDLFDVHCCPAVRAEIVTTDPDQEGLIFPQAMLFVVFERDGRIQPAEPERPEPLFGPGEAHAIALARERGWWLLINDARPLRYALGLGLSCVSVPRFTLLLYAAGRLTTAAARGILQRLHGTTAPGLIEEAERSLEAAVHGRGEE